MSLKNRANHSRAYLPRWGTPEAHRLVLALYPGFKSSELWRLGFIGSRYQDIKFLFYMSGVNLCLGALKVTHMWEVTLFVPKGVTSRWVGVPPPTFHSSDQRFNPLRISCLNQFVCYILIPTIPKILVKIFACLNPSRNKLLSIASRYRLLCCCYQCFDKYFLI